MGLAELFTGPSGCCRSAPKSPPPPDSPEAIEAGKLRDAGVARQASANSSDKTIVEVLPCGDITNSTSPEAPSPTTSKSGHAEGFGVNQLNDAPEPHTTKQKVSLDAETQDAIQKVVLDVFGFEIHRGLNAKAWDDRAQALAAARAMCEKKQIPATVSNVVFMDACCKLVLVAIQDKVMPVYFDGLELIKYLCGEFFVDYAAEASEVVRNNLEEFLPVIIAKTADRNARSLEGTRQTLVFLARCACVGCSPVMAHIFCPVQNHKELAAIRGRLDLINHVIDEFGFSKSSTITMQLVMGFVRPHLDATDEKVRRAAVEVTVNCYKHKGDRTLKYITNVKPALLKLLQSRFAELDKPAKGKKGLPAVRGKGKTRKSGLPKRDSGAGQPFKPGVGGMDQLISSASPVNTDVMSMGGMGGNNSGQSLSSPIVPSPLSAQPSVSLRDEPFVNSPNKMMCPQNDARAQLPGSLNDMEGIGMGGDLDLDDDLMNEIEAY